MATDHPARKGRPRRRLVAQVRAEESTCGICLGDIDMSLDPQTHPLGSTVHEWLPLHRGGSALDRSNVCHAHRCCNSIAGERPITVEVRARCRAAVRSHMSASGTRGSRTW